jgi:hypothetical protein
MPQKTVSFTKNTLTMLETGQREFEQNQKVIITFSAYVEKIVLQALDK